MVEQSELNEPWTLVETPEALAEAVADLAAGEGPIAVDAERASGFRFFNNAYLVQFARRGSSRTYLIDPPAVGSFAEVQAALGDEEWILHAASQDLPCLRELGLDPASIFDTELAARLLGYERVGLGAVIEKLLGIHLAKAHSAADWSTRPLPPEWLEYAALDVALLPEVRDLIAADLAAADKTEIARQEFEAVRLREPKPPAEEPWRKLSGSHKVSGLRGLAIARELWNARDALGREIDTAPGRLLPDASIVAASMAPPRSQGELAAMKTFNGRASRSELPRWWQAILAGKTTEDLPLLRPAQPKAIPHHRSWADRYPEADRRLKAARPLVEAAAEELQLPSENLLTPELLRRVAWKPPRPVTPESIAAALAELGVRPWQLDVTAPIIAAAFVEVD